MPQWTKPENALRRAIELLEVNKRQDALDTLHDVIKARKHRTWTKVHEVIMTKHLELCVDLRKPHLAKDGLFQYRNMCQQVNVKSLEDVITQFLEYAEKRAEQARLTSQGMAEDVAEDLEQAESPERLLLSAVSGEGAQDRADRSLLSPWLRFLWESYRQCLELLRNNVQVEQLYHKVAKLAFQFCSKYQRRTEFRKLCDNLRTHLNQLQKSHPTHFSVKLNNADTLALHQETRLVQLDVAIQMELWQEAFKSAEDVHQLMQSTKRSTKAATLASYYEKLALIFWKAGNSLYHAASLLKLFQLSKELKKSFSSEEATQLGTRVLLATLSIRWNEQSNDLARHLDMEDVHLEHQRRLAALLSWPAPPTRKFLLKEVQRLNVVHMALSGAQHLYQWLECEFSPLKLAHEIVKQVEIVKNYGKPDYDQYIDSLYYVAALKILKQISQVYRSISVSRLLKIIPFLDAFRLERLIVAAGKRTQIQVRIDHRCGSVEFGVGEALTFGAEDDESAGGVVSNTQIDVPVIQTMPNEQIREYLQQMYTALKDSVDTVDPDLKDALIKSIRNHTKLYAYHATDTHKMLLERKKKIESYKESNERVKQEQEERQKEQERRELEKRQREEQQRLAQEKQERTEAQRRREQEEMQRRVMQDRIELLKDPNLRRVIKDLPEEEIQNLDADALLQKQITHMEQERRDHAHKLLAQEKNWDYYIRAVHIEEISMREEEHKECSVKDKQRWDQYELERLQREEEEYKIKVVNHERLTRIDEDARQFLKTVRDARASLMQERMTAWQNLLKETRVRRKDERNKDRKQKRRQDYLKAKEAEKQKKEEEERQRREAEEMRRKPGEDGRRRFDDRRDTGRYPGGGRGSIGRDDVEEGAPGSGADSDQWRRVGPIPGAAGNERERPRVEADDNWRASLKTDAPDTRRPVGVQRPGGPPAASRADADLGDWRNKAAPAQMPPERELERRDLGEGRDMPGREMERRDFGGRDNDRRDVDLQREPDRRDFGPRRDFGTTREPERRDIDRRDFGSRDIGRRDYGPPRDIDRREFGSRDIGRRDYGPPRDIDRRDFGSKDTDRRDYGPPRDIDRRDFGSKDTDRRDYGPPRDIDRRDFGSKDTDRRDYGPPRDIDRRDFGSKDTDRRDYAPRRDIDRRDFGTMREPERR